MWPTMAVYMLTLNSFTILKRTPLSGPKPGKILAIPSRPDSALSRQPEEGAALKPHIGANEGQLVVSRFWSLPGWDSRNTNSENCNLSHVSLGQNADREGDDHRKRNARAPVLRRTLQRPPAAAGQGAARRRARLPRPADPRRPRSRGDGQHGRRLPDRGRRAMARRGPLLRRGQRRRALARP